VTEKIGFVCDSTADFPEGMADRLGLHILPVHIFVDGTDHLHGVTIDNQTVIENLKKQRDVFTKPFFPVECADFFENMLETYDTVVSFHLSTHMSGNFQSATNALNLMYEEDAERVKVMDLGGVSISLALLVKRAVELLGRDPNTHTLEKRMAPFMNDVFMGFTVENLIWLKKGGRVSSFAAFVGRMLDIKPVINLQDARLIPTEKHRGKKPALKRLVEMAEEQNERFNGNCDVWLAHAQCPEEVAFTREKIAVRLGKPARQIHVVETGATISVHTGPGSICVAMLPAAPTTK
jgi:fatty acid kinase fatty acid binding subunit